MLEGWTLFAMGFFLGLRHATDADHVLAVSVLVSREQRLGRSTLLGLSWGFGHLVALCAAGVLVFIYRVAIPPEAERLLEVLVGGMLILLGGSVLVEFARKGYHFHRHRHGETVHWHLHRHVHGDSHDHVHPGRLHLRTLLVGMLHGLAGSAPLFLLILAAVNATAAALFYLLAYGAGAMLGMAALSLLLGISFRVSRGNRRLNEGLRLTAGCGSLALGLFIAITAIR